MTKVNRLILGSAASILSLFPTTIRAQPSPGDAFPKRSEPYLAAYRWGAANRNGGAGANEAYAKWLGRPAVWAEDFTPTERWENAIEGGGWQLGEWQQWKKAAPGRRLILSVPLLPGPWDRSGATQGPEAKQPVSLEAGAKGAYNEHFRKLAENLVKYELADSVLRLGWEFNGGWYTWRVEKTPEPFAAYWRETVKTMRAVPGAAGLRFCWNPCLCWWPFDPEKAWPGDAFVDLVGLDLYDQSYQQDTYPWPDGATPSEIERRQHKTWEQVLLSGNHGLTYWKDFSARHKKPFCLPEWGIHMPKDKHGGGDNPFFVEQMQRFIADPANNVYFHCYFDVTAPDGAHQLSPGKNGCETTRFPQAAAKFKALFGTHANQ